MTTETKIQIYKSLIISNILYASEVWANNLQVICKKKIKRIVKFYAKVARLAKYQLQTMLNEQYNNKFQAYIQKIRADNCHPLHYKIMQYHNSNSRTRRKWTYMYTRTTSYSDSFVPKAIRTLTEGCTVNII